MHPRYVAEPLERRTLLASTFTWINRSNFTGTNDNRFDDVFGTLAGQAIGVVDAALNMWQRVIDNFNYSNGTNTYNVMVTMNTSAQGSGAGTVGLNASPTAFIGNKPSAGNVSIGWRSGITPTANTSSGWYLDPSPLESSEFQGAFFNGYARAPTASLGAADLLTGLLHEMGHALGLSANTSTAVWATNTGVTDTINTPASSPVSTYWRFNAPSGNSLWTSWDSGGAGGGANNANGAQHFAPLGATVTQGGVTYSGAVALMNAAFTNRSIISDIEALTAGDTYNYSIIRPSTFGTTYNQLDADGTLRINTTSLGASADFVDVLASGGTLTTAIDTGLPVAGIDNVGIITSTFPLSSVQRITITTGDGDDTVRVRPISSSIPVTINAGNGTDQLQVWGDSGYDNIVVDFTSSTPITSTALNLQTVSLFENLSISTNGGDADISLPHTDVLTSLQINGSPNAETINLHRLDLLMPTTIFAGLGNDVINLAPGRTDNSIRSAVTINGFDGNDTVNLVPSSPVAIGVITAPITFNGDADNDTLNIASGFLDAVSSPITFNGGATSGGLGNQIFLYDNSISLSYDYNITTTSVTRNASFGGVNYSNTDRITLQCSQGGNNITVASGVGPIIEAFGNDGDDNFIVGGGLMDSGAGPIVGGFNGGNGTDRITYDDHLRTTGVIWDVHPTAVYYGGIFQLSTTGFESVGILAGSGDDDITFYNEITKPISVDAGAGNDDFTSLASNAWSVTCLGGTGHDYLHVDDRNIAASFDESSVTPTAITRIKYTGSNYAVNYNSIEDIDYHLPNAQNFVSIYGTATSIDPGYATELHGNSSTDTFALYPFDGSGNPAFNTDLFINGGLGSGDQVQVNAASSSLGSTYTFSNPFGLGAHVSGLGPGKYVVGNDVETHTINAGSGMDTFNIEAYVSGTALSINGNGGNDIVNFTPSGQNLGTITNMPSFNFNGGADYDYMVVHNGNNTACTYYTYNGGISVLRHSDGKQWGMSASNIDSLGIYAGAFNDFFNIWGTNPGVFTELFGQGGNDSYTVGGIIGQTMQIINSPVRIHGEGGGADAIQLQNSEDTVGRTFHIAQTIIGGAADDNLFAPGGYIDLWSFAGSITIDNGSGADTIYAEPNMTSTLSINGANPTSAPGDVLNLAFAGVTGINFTPGATGAGSYTFSNRATLSYSGIETKNVDDVAPQILTRAFDAALTGQSISFSFNENVSASLSVNSLQLSGASVSTADMQYQYLPGNIARWTFPGLGGILPGGSFNATIVGATDPVGNPATGTANWRFIWARGTSGDDTFSLSLNSGSGKTFEVFVNGSPTPTYTAPAASLNQLNVWGDTGNDTLIINARRGGRPAIPIVGGAIFDGGNGTDTVSILATSTAESTTFSSGQVAYVSTAVPYVGVEQAAYDEADGATGDSVTVSGGPAVHFLRTQRLASLSIGNSAAAIVNAGVGATLVLNTLSLASGGALDLTDNDLVVNNGSYSAMRALVNAGFGNTTGIISSVANGSQILALFDNAQLSRGDWNGIPIGANAVVGKFTYFGDANIDGQVTGDDYTVIDANLNTVPLVGVEWLRGDMNRDAAVTGDDYTVVDSRLGLGVGNPLSPSSARIDQREALKLRGNSDLL